MSHFSVAVFTDDKSPSVDDLMEPYFEGNTYPPRLIFTRQQAIDKVRKQRTEFAKKSDDECFEYMSQGYITDFEGNIYDNSNPFAKWDWYDEECKFDLLKLKSTGELVNSAKIKDVDFTDFCTFAVVTRLGVWFECGHMGWFAVVSDEDENWGKNYYSRFIEPENPETTITIVDCHI